MERENRNIHLYLLLSGIFLIGFFWSSFFLQGLPLWDNDYNKWIAQARELDWSTALCHVFNPVLKDWNVDFRPTQTLIFKALFSMFGYHPSGYYYFKSLMLAVFSALYFIFLRRFLGNTVVAALSALFLSTAYSTFTSLRWVSDFVVVSELLALIVYAVFLNLESIEKPSKKAVVISLVLMVIFTLICDRTKANGKLIPGILVVYILLTDWRKMKRYWPAIGMMAVLLLPWKVLTENPAPFLFAGRGTVKSYAWQPASLGKLWDLFGGDFGLFTLLYPLHPPTSILALIGFPLLYVSILAAVVLIYRKAGAGKAVRFLIIWALVNIAALLSYPSLPLHFKARYAISVLAPLVPLLLLSIYRATQMTFRRRKAPGLLIAGLVVAQILFHGYHTFRARNGPGSNMIAWDAMMQHVSENFRNTHFYYIDIPVLSFRPSGNGNRFFSSLNDDFGSVMAVLPANADLYVISMSPLSEPFLQFQRSFPGKSESLYDRIFNSEETRFYEVTYYLYKFSAGG